MIRYEDGCCDCSVPGFPCDNSCPLRHYPVYYCDKCGDDCMTLYWFDGMQLCESCVLSELEEVE